MKTSLRALINALIFAGMLTALVSSCKKNADAPVRSVITDRSADTNDADSLSGGQQPPVIK